MYACQRAARAAYDGDQDRMTLTGGVEVTDAGSELWANQVTIDKATGDSQAVGGVKVDYVEDLATHDGKAVANGAGGVGEPTHFLADRAEKVQATDTATFHGKPVRMWRGGDQVLAPVIELARGEKRMIARGEAGTGGRRLSRRLWCIRCWCGTRRRTPLMTVGLS